jgi:hypothetical protein
VDPAETEGAVVPAVVPLDVEPVVPATLELATEGFVTVAACPAENPKNAIAPAMIAPRATLIGLVRGLLDRPVLVMDHDGGRALGGPLSEPMRRL